MTRLNTLQYNMGSDAFIISNPMSIFYYLGVHFEVGERFLGLILYKDRDPILLIHEMFSAPVSIPVQTFKDSDPIHMILDALIPHGTIAVDSTFKAQFLLPLLNASRTFINGSPWIDAQRAIKTQEEQALMLEASHHNDRIMESLKQYFVEGVTELEIAARIQEAQSTEPLSGVSFTPIAVFSENIADPHGIPSSRKLRQGDAILIDMGGIYKDYCSDMTRVFFFGDNPELEALYEIVLEANLAAIAAIKPGVRFMDIDAAARNVIANAGYGEHFIHRTGHGIGIECHETLDVSSSNMTLVEEGMCFSIEPGIYIQGVGGIRIEDLVTVTEAGCTVLNQAPKALKDVKL